ncbi:TPA: hypothetical protein MDR36_001494 [Klebsiella quasipneumoniae]|nr:hypothetical protein [Klebsiella quasipneumoniae]
MPQRYNTGNQRPSNSMKDVNDNALAFDDYMNSDSDTFVDRLENERDSLRGTIKKILSEGESAVGEARQNLIPLSRQYMTLAAAQADIANIPVGASTYYRSPDDSALAIEVINTSGTLQPTGRKMPSAMPMGYQSATAVSSGAANTIAITIPGLLVDGSLIYFLSPILNTGAVNVTVTDAKGNIVTRAIQKQNFAALVGNELLLNQPVLMEYRTGTANTCVLVASGPVAAELATRISVLELKSVAFDQLNTFFSRTQLSAYTGSGPVYPYALDTGGKVLLGYDQEAGSIVGAGLLSTEKVSELIERQLSTTFARLGLARYKGDGPVFPWHTDSNGTVLLGYDTEKQRVVGAIEATGNIPIKSELKPLPFELRPVAKSMNIMHGYGQSLSVGAQGNPVLSTTQPYSNLTFASGPRGYNRDYSALSPLVEDNRTAPDGGANRGETFCSGAANYASTLLAEENGMNPADHVIFASTAGKGGTKIADLVKGTYWYNTNFLPQVNGAYNLNPDSAVHAILWAQGETDNDQSTPTPFATYRDFLQQLQIDAEADIKAVNGQTSPVHFLTYQTSYKVKTSTGVALAQLDLTTNNDKFHFVSPCYHLPFYTDSTHLTNVGYKWLGAYFGRAYKTLVHDQCYPQFLRPVSAVLRGNVVTLTLDVPVPPVVLDTTNLAATTDNGFVVKGSTSGTALTIASMRAEGNKVKITLAATPEENIILRYALDYLGAGLTIVNGASGNLRDSDPSTINIQGVDRPLFHVCPHFEMNVIKVGE